jgi:hypothetical protein
MSESSKKASDSIDRKKLVLSVVAAAMAAVLVIGASSLQSLSAKSAAASTANPTEGYDIHVTVNKHDSAHLDAHMDHYCKLDPRIVAVCQLYATENNVANDETPQLAQLEFIITDDQYLTLPLRERANWHNHAVELSPERGMPTCEDPGAVGDCATLVSVLQGTYGKVVTVWDPADPIPNYPPYAFLVDSPFALNQDLNDDLEEEWPVGDESTGSADDVPPCNIKQAGPCGNAH